MSGTVEGLRPGQVLEGPSLPGRTEVVAVMPTGDLLRLVGKGLESGQFVDLYLSAEQLAGLRVVGGEADYRGDAVRFKLGIEAMRLGLAYEYDPYFSLSTARVDPLPHQLEAIYDYFLKLPRIRFLLADDAGAGKTIMAGLLLKELKMRGLVQRVLVVAPANLAFQWQREMRDRFRETFEILRGIDLQSAYGTNPWQDRRQVIASIDWAKRQDVRESLSRVRWDLVFVDEAHRMSASDPEHKTERYQLGELLSERTDHLVLLTATPHKGDPDNFCLFLRLLDRDVYGDVRSLEEAMRRQEAPFYLRRTKEVMVTFPDPQTGRVQRLFRPREVETVPFQLLDDEHAFYQQLTRYVQEQSMRAARDPSARGRAIGFTMAMYQRRFASSLAAAVRSLERRREKLHRQLKRPALPSAVPSVDWEDLEELDEARQEEVLEAIEEASLPVDRAAVAAEIQAIDALLRNGRSLREGEVSSKLQRLRRLLQDRGVFQDQGVKLLVFTEHKDTLDWLVERIRGWGLSVTQIHGGMKVGDRDTPGTRLHAERVFREEAQVMVATEAAGEGINLQFCWLMVNYDIPWNPVRLEQRMGRIHRYGQTHDCLIFNFVAVNTFEGRVLAKLLDRLKEIRRELGSDQVFDVVGEVLRGNRIEQLIRDRYAGRTSEQAVIDEVAAEVDPERFRRITQSALESLARKDMNPSDLVGRLAEAKERRLVPEVVEDFFLRAAPLHELPPRKATVGYRLGRLPRPVLEEGIRQEQRFGRLGRQYGTVVFDKKDLERVPTAEWVTPGHPLFEAVRGLTERTAADQPYDRARQLTMWIITAPEVKGKPWSYRRGLLATTESGTTTERARRPQSHRQYRAARSNVAAGALGAPPWSPARRVWRRVTYRYGRRPMTRPSPAESDQHIHLAYEMQGRLHPLRFRPAVATVYDNVCMACRLQHQESFDAKHISLKGYPQDDPTLSNGPAMRKVHHGRLNSQIVGIPPRFVIEVRRDVPQEIDRLTPVAFLGEVTSARVSDMIGPVIGAKVAGRAI